MYVDHVSSNRIRHVVLDEWPPLRYGRSNNNNNNNSNNNNNNDNNSNINNNVNNH